MCITMPQPAHCSPLLDGQIRCQLHPMTLSLIVAKFWRCVRAYRAFGSAISLIQCNAVICRSYHDSLGSCGSTQIPEYGNVDTKRRSSTAKARHVHIRGDTPLIGLDMVTSLLDVSA